MRWEPAAQAARLNIAGSCQHGRPFQQLAAAILFSSRQLVCVAISWHSKRFLASTPQMHRRFTV